MDIMHGLCQLYCISVHNVNKRMGDAANGLMKPTQGS